MRVQAVSRGRSSRAARARGRGGAGRRRGSVPRGARATWRHVPRARRSRSVSASTVEKPEPPALEPGAEHRHRHDRPPREAAHPVAQQLVAALAVGEPVRPPEALGEARVGGRVAGHVPAPVEAGEDGRAQVLHRHLTAEVQVPDVERVGRQVVLVVRRADALEDALRERAVSGGHGVPHRSQERRVLLVERPTRVGLVKAVPYRQHPHPR